MKVCPECETVVKDLRRHKARNRCKAHHSRARNKPVPQRVKVRGRR